MIWFHDGLLASPCPQGEVINLALKRTMMTTRLYDEDPLPPKVSPLSDEHAGLYNSKPLNKCSC